jgi:hypothetical protein
MACRQQFERRHRARGSRAAALIRIRFFLPRKARTPEGSYPRNRTTETEELLKIAQVGTSKSDLIWASCLGID